MIETLEYVHMFAQFPSALRRFARGTLSIDQARGIIHERLEHREENFIRVVERGVYGQPRSPYLALLKLAGCELGDLKQLVQHKGLEGALGELRKAGVYVTFEEFKGRKPIVRGGKTIQVTARDFDNPCARRDFSLQTGGSTGLSTTVNQDLDYVVAGMPHHLTMLAAWDLLGAPMACWMAILPGGGFRFLLQRAYLRERSLRWFSTIGWRDSKRWLQYDLATLYMVFWARAWGTNIPWPETVRPNDAIGIAHWMRDQLRAGQRCLLYSSVSGALRVSVAAQQAGFALEGATFRVGGEPATRAKVSTIRRVGARVVPTYGSIETGTIGHGCPRPCESDDLHLLADAYALITFPYSVEGAGVTVPAFNLTSLLGTSPKLMLNYQSDDYGMVEERKCGCEFDACGYVTHLSKIRSYSKLVGEGVTLIGNEMMEIIEHVLPTRFGGSALDYQLAEEEDEQGYTRLYLSISPRIAIEDEAAVLSVVHEGLRTSSSMADAAGGIWRHASTIRIRRIEPALTARGKLLPLHIQHSKRND